MIATLRRIPGFLLLALLSALAHLVLLWLWNPMETVPPPRIVKVAARPPGPSGEVNLIFGGDTALTDAASATLKRFGYEYPLAPTLDLIRSAHLAVVNLEAPVADRDTPFPLYKRYVYRMKRPGLDALAWAGVDLVSLANNHILDQGREGLRSTLRHLKGAGMAGVGAGPGGAEARRGVVVEVGGVRVGLLSYMEDSFMHSLYMRSFAWWGWPGCARLEAGALKEDIRRLRRHADLVIILAHWGRYYTGVTLLQRLYGRLMVDYGADAVIGHHPHIHHPIGTYKGKPLLYSLGNYAFGTPGWETFRHGLLARLVVSQKKLVRLEIIPLLTQNREIGFKPEPLVGEEARVMLEGLKRESLEYGTELKISGNMAVMKVR